jgi:hypothetical protein
MKVTDEMLMSLVDGELDEETALGVMRSVDADPALRRRLAEFQETRVLAKQAFGAVLEEPVPARLVAAVGKAGRGGPIGWPWPTSIWLPIGAAVAASVAGFAVATALMAPRDVPALLPDSQEIASLLQTTPTGEARPWADKRGAPGSGVFQATGSYPFPEGVCRAFSLSTSAADAIEWRGVACHHGEVWNVEIIVAPGDSRDSAAVWPCFSPPTMRFRPVHHQRPATSWEWRLRHSQRIKQVADLLLRLPGLREP